MRVKICGITDKDTAQAAVNYGADALGFVFANSKRRIEPDRAKEIISTLPDSVMKVGVFVNESRAELERIAAYVGLTYLQLHGNESAHFCASLSYPVIKAISIDGNYRVAELNEYSTEYVLIDGPKGKYHGGNGMAFDWNLLNKKPATPARVVLAGGLHEGNVERAIRIVQPDMVDVSSGVETNGKKDLTKIKSFIAIAKNTPIGGIKG